MQPQNSVERGIAVAVVIDVGAAHGSDELNRTGASRINHRLAGWNSGNLKTVGFLAGIRDLDADERTFLDPDHRTRHPPGTAGEAVSEHVDHLAIDHPCG